ncbi:hypothetical protein HPB52_006132 [Rhipicephalus sanguineus]|uniref:Transposase Tc1-like domain-containing protein n=1 Tax=Rhipicephalus sanguineus TaxID=34632 RepID=A0A9D4PVW4_RHISA|nr:hypothetical protein HPB52_006132 [Rhipicephalus sanguineus]
MPPRVPADEKRRIVDLSIPGLSQRVICRLLGRSRTAVNHVIQTYRETGRIAESERSGRCRCTEDEVDILIVATVVADPHISAKGIRDALQLDVSISTIRRRLVEAGLKNCVAAQKPHITERQRTQRLQFALSVQTWSSPDWNEVVFSDESTFSSRWDQKRRILAAIHAENLCQRTMHRERLGRHEPTRTWSTGAHRWEVDGIKWPPVGADLNPIEIVWGLIKRQLAARNLGRATKDTLWTAVREEWEALRARPEIVAALYESMPRRVAQVIAADGHLTKY